MVDIETHPHDVLVIGAGGAGLRAAIAASSAGANVGLVCKSLLGKAHTVMAEGGIAASLANVADRDTWQVHFRDTMVGGKLINNPRMAELHAKEAPERVRELERWGAVFDRTRDGRILQRPFGGHTHPRLAHVGDRTGLEMIRTLQDRTVASDVKVHMECIITHLVSRDGRVAGAVGYWRTDGRPVLFPAKSVVLATGGIGRAWEVTSNSWEYSGDGHALAYLAGAELIDMEFVQFHPTGMVWPPGVRGLLVTEAVRGEGGILRNSLGERFMWRYLPDDRRAEYAQTDEEATRWVEALTAGLQTDARRPPELSTRDNVARAIYTEVREGRGTPHGGVFLDISYLPAERVRRKLPSMYDQFSQLADVDITEGPMEVGPTMHYTMGGVRVDAETGATTRPGLYAAGRWRAACTAPTGWVATRCRTCWCSVPEPGLRRRHRRGRCRTHPRSWMQTSRRRSGSSMRPDRRGPGEPHRLHEELKETMQTLVGIFRTEADLEVAQDQVAALRARWPNVRAGGPRAYNPGADLVFELRNMLLVSEVVTRAARTRTESRGAHSRLDYPATDKAWEQLNVVVSAAGSEMQVRTVPTIPIPDELRELLVTVEERAGQP